jgi:hypothetical protein
MPREENKSSNDAQAKAAEKLPSIPEAVPADSAPGPAQTAAPNKPERSSGKQSKRRRWLLKAGAGIAALAVALYFARPAAMRAFNTISTDDAYVTAT